MSILNPEAVEASIVPIPAANISVVTSANVTETNAQTFIDNMAINTRLVTTMTMVNNNYTLTPDQAKAGALVVFDSGDGTKVMTIPTSQDGVTPAMYGIVTAYSGNPFYMESESGGGPTLINAPEFDVVAYAFGSPPASLYAGFIDNTAFAASWDTNIKAPTKNAVYDKFKAVEKDYTQSFLFMGS